jgi:hypothetical protein
MNTAWVGARGFRRRVVEISDARDPMTRLLEDGQDGNGFVFVRYDQQWKTVARAQRDGMLDENQRITDKGRDYLRRYGTKA